jgi:hypothetical protein
MSDINTETVTSRKRRGPQPKGRIDIPGSDDYLEPRVDFAASIGVTDKTVSRMNLPTTYIGNVAYIRHNEGLQALAARVRCRHEPQKKRQRRARKY